MSHVSRKYEQFAYFDAQLGHPSWRGKRVLDFGGNAGNILRTAKPGIDEENYWSIDVSADGIAAGRRDFPKAHWIWYDRYNIEFNPGGSQSVEIPRCEHPFDFIVSYSVFTHMDRVEMARTVERLLGMLAPDGVLAFTFIDPHFHSWPEEYPGSNLRWRLERMSPRVQSAAAELERRVRDVPCFTLIGDGDIYPGADPVAEPERYLGQEYHVFHTAGYMRQLFPRAGILPPANYEMQHCCVLRSPARAERSDRLTVADTGTPASGA